MKHISLRNIHLTKKHAHPSEVTVHPFGVPRRLSWVPLRLNHLLPTVLWSSTPLMHFNCARYSLLVLRSLSLSKPKILFPSMGEILDNDFYELLNVRLMFWWI